MTVPVLNDAAHRHRAEREVHRNFAVEAGAGSGKTTTIVRRVRSLVEADVPLDQLAAVTFTRAAAAELRTRMIAELDGARREALGSGDAERAGRFARALGQLDAAYVGTIHGFCARLLRERPVEARLDPDFTEIEGSEWQEWVMSWLHGWRAAREAEGAMEFAQLRALRVGDAALVGAFATMVDEPDVDFSAPSVPLPAREAVEAALATLRAAMEPLLAVVPTAPLEDRRDKAQSLLLGARAAMARAAREPDLDARRIAGLLVLERFLPSEAADDADGTAMLDRVIKSMGTITGKLWLGGKKKVIDGLVAEFAAVYAGRLLPLVRELHAHRHALAMQVLDAARHAFADERRRLGRLGFADLLVRAAALLRESADARAALGARFTRLIVDEFQDTDPVQAELCFLLAAPNDPETDWRRVTPEQGRLFVVGDPKQSIYRFRRADLGVYAQACARLVETGGAQLHFTANFRSTHAVGRFVNAHFATAFAAAPGDVDRQQAPFAPLDTVHADTPHSGVQFVVHDVDGQAKGAVKQDAAESAARVAARLADPALPLNPSDVLILGRRHHDVRASARALAAAGVPVAVDGLGDDDAPELQELLILVEALLAPTEEVPVVAALMGPAAGVTLAELHEAREAGTVFDLTVPPAPDAEPNVAAGLMALQAWWTDAAVLPADVLLGRMLDQTGLLAWAACGALGAARAGTLLALLDAVREGGRTLEIARTLLAQRQTRESVAPRALAGTSGAVRVMTVHGAKGLEARVVHVVGPSGQSDQLHLPGRVVQRQAEGRSVGIVPLREGRDLVAAPPIWESLLAAEMRRAAEELDRLRYVAVTRAAEELRLSLVLKHTKAHGAAVMDTFASPFRPQLDDVALATQVELLPERRVDLQSVTAPPSGHAWISSAPAFRATSVTLRASDGAAETDEAPRPADLEALLAEESDVADGLRPADARTESGAGLAWGRAVHRALEGVLRGRQGGAFDAFCAAVLAAEFPDVDAVELQAKQVQLRKTLDSARASPAWARLAAAPYRAAELGVLALDVDGEVPLVEVGVVDAAALDDDGWTVLDWKTTAAAAFEAKQPEYQRQVARYAERLAARHDAPTDARVVRVWGQRTEEQG